MLERSPSTTWDSTIGIPVNELDGGWNIVCAKPRIGHFRRRLGTLDVVTEEAGKWEWTRRQQRSFPGVVFLT